jgi:Ribbon-helix-helix protein, copG family
MTVATRLQSSKSSNAGKSDIPEITGQRTVKSDKINYKRMSIALPEHIAELLEALGQEQGITQNEAIKRAILTEAYIQRELLNGSDILVRKQGQDTLERLVFM